MPVVTSITSVKGSFCMNIRDVNVTGQSVSFVVDLIKPEELQLLFEFSLLFDQNDELNLLCTTTTT